MSNAIAKKLLLVRESVGVVAKGRDPNQNFQYQKWDDVFPAVWDACVSHQVVISQTVDAVTYHEANPTGRGTAQKRVEVRMTFRVIDAESGECLESSWHGESVGADDKILQKAITSATKYFFLKGFGIPFEEKDGDTDGAKPDVSGKSAPKPKREPERMQAPEPEPEAPAFDWAAYAKDLFTQKEWEAFKKANPGRAVELLSRAWDNDVSTKDELDVFLTSIGEKVTA